MKSRLLLAIAAIVLVLLGLRIALPFWLTGHVNRTLSQLEGYEGRVEDIDLHLFRGAYQIEGPVIRRTSPPATGVPLFEATVIDLSISWRGLLRGALVGDVVLRQPVLNFVDVPGEADQTGAGRPWQEVARDLMPLQVDHFAVVGGEIHWRNFQSEPPVDVYVQQIELSARNLRNTLGKGDELPATITGEALAMNSGRLELDAAADPLDQPPDFDLDVRLLGTQLPELNPWLRAYTGLDAAGGELDVVLELAAQDGALTGYLKPLARNVDLVDMQQDANLLDRLYESAAGLVVELLENQPRDQLATRVPIEGRLDDAEVGVWPTLVNVLRNAFIEAFRPGFEDGGQSD